MLPSDEVSRLMRQLAYDQARYASLTGLQLESVVAQLFARNAEFVEISRNFAPRVDLMLSVKDQLQGMQRIAIECKALQNALTVRDMTSIRAMAEAVEASRYVLVTNSFLTEQAKAYVEATRFAVEIIDRDRLSYWVDQFQKQQADLAAALAYRFGRLTLEPLLTSVDDQFLVDATEADFDTITPAQYRERIITVERLPFRILRRIMDDPRHLEGLSPRQFEEFTAEVLEALGFQDVILTPPSGDGGRDVIASKEVNSIPLTFYFECKKYAPDNRVQIDTLRSLLGVVAHNSRESNIGVLVTTSKFTRGAKQLIISECRLDGKDYDGIMGWVSEARNRVREIV